MTHERDALNRLLNVLEGGQALNGISDDRATVYAAALRSFLEEADAKASTQKPTTHMDDGWLADRCAESVDRHKPDEHDTMYNYLGFARDIRDAVLEEVAEQGVMLPVEPTDDILYAGFAGHYRLDTRLGKAAAQRDYREMLVAAQPSQEVSE